jgi:hypothetical protein
MPLDDRQNEDPPYQWPRFTFREIFVVMTIVAVPACGLTQCFSNNDPDGILGWPWFVTAVVWTVVFDAMAIFIVIPLIQFCARLFRNRRPAKNNGSPPH